MGNRGGGVTGISAAGLLRSFTEKWNHFSVSLHCATLVTIFAAQKVTEPINITVTKENTSHSEVFSLVAATGIEPVTSSL